MGGVALTFRNLGCIGKKMVILVTMQSFQFLSWWCHNFWLWLIYLITGFT